MSEKKSRENCICYHNNLCGKIKCYPESCDEYTPIPEEQAIPPVVLPRVPQIDRIIDDITKGIDPTTGEVFDIELLTRNTLINDAIRRLAQLAIPDIELPPPPSYLVPDEELFQLLRSWRYSVACERGVPAFYVFSDKTLRNLAEARPRKKEDLLTVKGIGKGKYCEYGDDIYNIICSFQKRH